MRQNQTESEELSNQVQTQVSYYATEIEAGVEVAPLCLISNRAN
jgi:hypothetical protein